MCRYNPTEINLDKLELKTCKLVLWDPLIPPLISKSDQIYVCVIYTVYIWVNAWACQAL
jgi:hypothetical protein